MWTCKGCFLKATRRKKPKRSFKELYKAYALSGYTVCGRCGQPRECIYLDSPAGDKEKET